MIQKKLNAKLLFIKATGLKQSEAWNIFAKYGATYDCSKILFRGVDGADHSCVFQKGRKYLWTTEPYKGGSCQDRLLDYCEKYGWSIVLSDYPGWWNPPYTELWLLAPPYIGLNPSTINQDLIYSHYTRHACSDECRMPQ